MKKNILSAIFCLALCNLIISVSYGQSPLRLGLRLSPIVSFASVTDNDKNTINGVDASGRLGINGGLIGVYQFTDKFGIQSGLQICTRGFTVTRPNAEQSSQVTIVEIPALLHMRTSEISNGLRARGIFGSTIGILAGASSDIKVNGTSTSDKKGDNFSSLQFDFTFGAGAEWR
jgi:Outer membrane protein beta-barrel domain